MISIFRSHCVKKRYDSLFDQVKVESLSELGGMAKKMYPQPEEIMLGCMPGNDREIPYFMDVVAEINANDASRLSEFDLEHDESGAGL